MEKLEPIDLSYAIGTRTDISNRFKTIADIRNDIKSDNLQNIDTYNISNSPECEILNLINLISNLINESIDATSEKLRFLISLCNKIYEIINNKKYHSQKMLEESDNLVKEIKSFYQKCYSSDPESVKSLAQSTVDVLTKFKDVVFKCNKIDEYPSKVDIIDVSNDNESLTESILNTTSMKIYSNANPNGTNIVGKNQTQYNADEYIINLIKIQGNAELMMAKLPEIRKYFNKVKNTLSIDNIDMMKNIINHAYNELVINNTGLELLKNEMLDILHDIDSCDTVNDTDLHRSLVYLRSFINKRILDIDRRVNINTSSDDIPSKYDLLGEMGCAFMYAFPEEMSLDDITLFNEAIDQYLPDDFLDDVTNSLTESIFKKNEYLQSQKEQRKASKQAMKYEKRDAKSAQRERDRDVMMYKGKVFTLTNATARSMIIALKKAVAAIGAGGVSALVFNKEMGIIIGALTFITAFCASKLKPSTERSRLALQLKTELEVIDSKIDEMERQGDPKNKAKLMRVKARMQECYNRIMHNLSSGDLAWI